MINFASLETLNNNTSNNYDLWSKDEKMAYCESSSALISERKNSSIINLISNLFVSILG